MKKLFVAFVLGLFSFGLNANVTAYFSYGVFNVPNGTPFLETYITVLGKSVKYKAVTNGYQSSVNVKVLISKSGQNVAGNNYNLRSPIDKDTLHPSSFIDNQRYPLGNGVYVLEITLTDNNDPLKKSFTSKETFTIDFSPSTVSGSSIQFLQSFSKTTNISSISKSGYDLIPYTVNYFADDQDKLNFYFEAYRADTLLGNNEIFLYSYYIERKEDLVKPDGLTGFKKQNAAKVNPLLAQLDISKLETGNYYLVIELRDKDNKLQYEKRSYFQRKKVSLQAEGYVKKTTRTEYEFFGNYNNADTLKSFVECLWPISNTSERDWAINQSIKKDPELMKKFIVTFWQNRTGDSLDPLILWLSYYNQVKFANENFKCGKQNGYYTDRGRVFLQYGPPNQRSQQPSEPNAYPYEIWQYYRIQDKANGQFYTNKKFVFVNKNVADGCFKLIHSDMRGEVYYDKWQYEISKGPKSPNLDRNNPDPIMGSQSNDLFNNPR